MFKPGDKVEYIGPSAEGSHFGPLLMNPGDQGVVIKACQCALGMYEVMWCDNQERCYPKPWLRLVPGEDEGLADWNMIKEWLPNGRVTA